MVSKIKTIKKTELVHLTIQVRARKYNISKSTSANILASGEGATREIIDAIIRDINTEIIAPCDEFPES